MGFFSFGEVVENYAQNSIKKAVNKASNLFLLAILAGMLIAFAALAASIATHTVTDVGMSKVLSGLFFPFGLAMIVFTGAELFTGNCLITMAVLEKKVSAGQFLRNLVVVYFSNLLGALVIDFLIFFCGNLDYSNGLLGAYTIKVALAKVNIAPVKAVASGILCNMLVCMAILMAGAAKDIAGKALAIFFPIWAFVVGGFEHCVANMLYIPAGMLAAGNPDYVAMAEEAYGITSAQCESITVLQSLRNFIPVTIGNIIGGAVCIGVMYFCIHRKDLNK